MISITVKGGYMLRNRRSGFSMVELAIVVSIIGILAALAIPLFKNIIVRSKISTLASDLRVHSESIRRFALEEGTYPTKRDIEDNRFGLTSRLDEYLSHSWYLPTPIGGVYRLNSSSLSSGKLKNVFIEVSAGGKEPLTVGYKDLMKLDKEIDDGSPGSGFVRISGRRVRYYLMVKK